MYKYLVMKNEESGDAPSSAHFISLAEHNFTDCEVMLRCVYLNCHLSFTVHSTFVLSSQRKAGKNSVIDKRYNVESIPENLLHLLINLFKI